MDEQPAGADWRAILLLIFSLGGALLAFTSALATLALTLFSLDAFAGLDVSPLSTLLAGSTLAAVGLLFLPVGYYSLRRLRGLGTAALVLPALRFWTWGLLPFLWLLAVTLASLFHDAPGALIYAPVLHFLAVALPLYLLARAALARIPLGSALRAWGVLGSGMSFSLVVALTLEVMVLAGFLLVLGAYLALNPEQIGAIERLAGQVQNAPNLESLLYVVAPVVNNPLTLLAALLFLSGFVPLIEESAKSLGVWLVVDRLSSPAQGFAMGVLSGAGFALIESLSASMTPDDTWAMTFAARAFSGLMHVLASGLTGMGVAYARLEERYTRLVGLFVLGVLVHSAWNAGAVLTVAGGLRITLANPEIDLPGVLLGLVGLAAIFVMAVVMAVGLIVLNARLRDANPSSPLAQPAPAQDQPVS
ncbi:MAG: PrsW family glutamic-type intramembrane protease [Chloroflexota bacterium]